jgi:hypothetical protein
MKKYLMMMLAAGLICTGCGKKADAPKAEEAAAPAEAVAPAEAAADADEFAEAQKKLDGVDFTDEGLDKLFAAPDAMVPVEYEALILSFGKCEMQDGKPDVKCISHKAVPKHRKARKMDGKDVYGVHKKMIRHKHPAVRGYAYDQLENLEDEAQIKEILEQMKNDKDSYVLSRGIRAMKNSLKHSKDLTDFVKGNIKHEHKDVRISVANAMGSKWNKDVEGLVDGLRTLLTDTDVDVRKTACQMAGSLGNDTIVPDMVKVIDNNEDKAQGECAKALVAMWYDFPAHENTSEAAYKAYLDYLKKAPRTANLPEWQAITNLKNTGKAKFDAWKAKATYFKAEELVAALADIAKDDAASKLARTNAIDVIAVHGTKADLEGMKDAIAASTSKDAKAVQESLNKAISKAK